MKLITLDGCIYKQINANTLELANGQRAVMADWQLEAAKDLENGDPVQISGVEFTLQDREGCMVALTPCHTLRISIEELMEIGEVA